MSRLAPMKELSIVLPAHNEEEVLEPNMKILMTFLEEAGLDYEIILCENASIDRTLEIGRRLAKQYPRISCLTLPRPELGEALREGFARATKGAVIFYPADLAHDRRFIVQALPLLDQYDVVYATRVFANMQRPVIRKIFTRIHPYVLKLLFGAPFSDVGSLKLYRRRVGQRVMSATRSPGVFVDVEAAVIIHRFGFTFVELPIEHHETRKPRLSFSRLLWTYGRDLVREFRYLRSLRPTAVS